MQEPDPQAVARAAEGDVAAFEELVRRYQGDVWRLACRLLGDDSLADDVTQDAFVRAYRFLPRYRGDARFPTWLFTIARNCALDELRRRQRRRALAQRAGAEQPAVTGEQPPVLEVREALARLPLELREPVVLIDMFGVSYREVADMVGAPVGTIKSRVHRARWLLARALAPDREERRVEG